MSSVQPVYRNQLLNALSAADRASISPHLELKDFALRFVFEEPDRPIKNVYFIERGFASVVARGKRDRCIEVALIGREGVSSIPVLMGDDRSPHSTYAQHAGAGYRISAAKMREQMQNSVTLSRLMLNYAHVFFTQAAQTALANGRANLDERLARWLLMGQDRINGNDLPMTHEFLSIMLGVRRAGVTLALHALEQRGLIKRTRAHIVLIDRKGLERAAGEMYGVPEAMHRRLIG